MKKYTVNITPNASDKLSQIFEYIAFELLEPIYAANQINRLQDKIQTLDTLPSCCKVFSKTLYPGHELRRLLVDNYSVFYFIYDQKVEITDIIYSKADILNRLSQSLH